jgi:cytoskeletal protein RodZ
MESEKLTSLTEEELLKEEKETKDNLFLLGFMLCFAFYFGIYKLLIFIYFMTFFLPQWNKYEAVKKEIKLRKSQ